MGALVYNGQQTIELDDRVLAHLQVVIITKLRRRESFAFAWKEDGQETVCWFTQSIPLQFAYSGERPSELNREWVELLAMAANTTAGLFVMPEPEPVAGVAGTRDQECVPTVRRIPQPTRSARAARPLQELVSA
ncbi:hypothetical protein J2X63_003434 [Agromyces sp. 3263]|uniref:DUF7882 family protein n=1 Tax=Agromyces sp. 3263 TaxID=2817750 RepID=UPI0028635408|nr:ATP-dependent DNA ligase [Agromyces sp. 3263]MDR6907726.1 hypothetical protein [Agromyces sp. 3263]